jgi:hypothetical protein
MIQHLARRSRRHPALVVQDEPTGDHQFAVGSAQRVGPEYTILDDLVGGSTVCSVWERRRRGRVGTEDQLKDGQVGSVSDDPTWVSSGVSSNVPAACAYESGTNAWCARRRAV